MRILAPSPALAPHVREMMLVEVGEDVTRLRLPEPGLVLGVRYRGFATYIASDREERIAEATLSGVGGRAKRMRTAAGSGVVLARFRPGGAAAFFGEGLNALFGTSVALEDLAPRGEVEAVRERVVEARGDAERVAAVEAFLLGRVRPVAVDRVVRAAVQAIVEARGVIRIGALARELGISGDRLEKRFRGVVGASPKQFASLVRVRGAIEAYRPGVAMARVAVEAGYFDEAHFGREVRRVIGVSAGRFLREGESGNSGGS